MSRSLVVRYRCGSAVVLALVCLRVNGEVPTAPDDTEWLERSRRILEESSEMTAPDWLRAQPAEAALQAAREVADRSMASRPTTGANPIPGRILIFASFSIPEPTLKSLLTQATEPNVVLVLRGVPKGSTVPGAIHRLTRLVAAHERVPQVVLDPTLFRRYAVERVPSFALERASHQKPVLVRGAVNTEWLRRMAASVRPGQENLGRRAEDYEIAEMDLIEEMQRRLANIDWVSRREKALANFWTKHNARFVELADARERHEVLVDPSVRVTQDLEDAEGNVLVEAGQTFNPLAWIPLSKTIIVFRGTDPRHVSKATELARAARASGRGVILLTTSIDTERGWAHLSELERSLSGAVYVLPAALVDRFQLNRIPATVASRGQQLLVTEVPIGDPQ